MTGQARVRRPPGRPGVGRLEACGPARLVALLAALGVGSVQAAAPAEQRRQIDGFAIDLTEVSVGRFSRFAGERALTTRAEREGGGHEYAAGWQRRRGWIWSAPYGKRAAPDEPAVHLTWQEARDYCHHAGGDLPNLDQWRHAAYRESRSAPTDGLQSGRLYPYPVGESGDGMNTRGPDPWPRHAPVGSTRRGVNGLYDMGGNVWEWLVDRDGDRALTAGGSWWYGADKTRAEGVQYKPVDFAAVYIGFRCVYPVAGD